MSRILRMNADDVERILARYGFELISQKGSHRKWLAKSRKQNSGDRPLSQRTRSAHRHPTQHYDKCRYSRNRMENRVKTAQSIANAFSSIGGIQELSATEAIGRKI